MKSIIPITKPLGLTPLEAIHLFKERYPEYRDQTISYAGRLDPMAEGLLLLLVGDANKQRRDYEQLMKTYDFQILLGVTTDTYDILGLTHAKPQTTVPPSVTEVAQLLQSFVGNHSQTYPPFSSRTVRGKPLYWWARHNRLSEIELPQKEINISSCALISVSTLAISQLEPLIMKHIALVRGDFRQTEIFHAWTEFFNQCRYTNISALPIVRAVVTCSSGTYIRGIAHEVGERLRVGGLALSINRTQIGDYRLEQALQL